MNTPDPTPRCASCEAVLTPQARFCPECGSAARAGRALPPSAVAGPGLLRRTAAGVSGMVGLPPIQRFSLGELLSEVLRRRGVQELEDHLMAGMRRTTPPVADIATDWPKPWLFARVFAMALLLYAVFHLGWLLYHNSNLLPGLMVIGSFVMPFAALVLFYELNTPRNVSMLLVIRLLLVGGGLSLLISLVLFQVGADLQSKLGASSAGFIEETGKLAAVVISTRKLGAARYRYTLNGLLFGAAVGAGFSAFESAGYAFNALLGTHSANQMAGLTLVRGVLSPFGHIVWTGIASAALWRVKGARFFRSDMLGDARFLRLFFFSILCHFLWNAGFDLPFFAKHLLLGLTAWMVVLSLVQDGLRQVQAEQAVARTLGPAHSSSRTEPTMS